MKMRHRFWLLPFLAIAAVPAAVQAADASQRMVLSIVNKDYYCSGCGTQSYNNLLLNDASQIALSYQSMGKSPYGYAQLYDASQSGLAQLTWQQPSSYTWPNGTWGYYIPGGPSLGGTIVSLNNNGGYIIGPHYEPSGMVVSGFSPQSVNDNGLIVGYSSQSSGTGMWINASSGATGSFTVSGMQGLSSFVVNNAGVVVGSGSVNGQTQAFVTNLATGQSRQLFDPTQVASSSLFDINSSGLAVGSRTLLDGSSVAFMYDTGTGAMTDLTQAASSSAKVNDQGEILLGNMFFDGASWIDLTTLTGFDSGLTFYDLNNAGDILYGHYYAFGGSSNNGGLSYSGWSYKTDYYVLSTVPEPGAALMWALGFLTVVAVSRRDRRAPGHLLRTVSLTS